MPLISRDTARPVDRWTESNEGGIGVVIATRSGRIRRLLQEVLHRLPQRDRLVIETFVGWVRCEREWGTYALGNMVDRRAASLLPLARGKRQGDERQVCLVLYLPVCRLLSDMALIGVLACMCARAARAAGFGKEWWRLMEDRWKQEEQAAERLATRWGFAPELGARTMERERVVLPRIDESERQIVTSIVKRIFSRS